MKTILLSAYAINPYKGSEDGMGWNFVCQVARFNKVIAITRENNAKAIEKYISENSHLDFSNIQFLYFDLPYWMRFWKRGGRGALLYYYMWQFFMPAFVRKSGCSFDIVHNLNFHNDWTPSRLWLLNKPFVWGPVGHHPLIPHEFVLGEYGTRQYFLDTLKWYTKKFIWRFDPFLKATVAHADAIIAMNNSVKQVIPVENKNLFIIPSVGSEPLPVKKTENAEKFHVISIGRFVPLKGFDVTVKSFARFYSKLDDKAKSQTKLTLIGKGPFKKMLVRLVAKLGIGKAVEFVDWVDREQLINFYSEASVFLFPSHEGAGMVVSEALSCGLPVICFDNSGPGEFVTENCGIKIPYSNYNMAVKQFARALFTLYSDRALLKKLSTGAVKRYSSHFNWNVKGEQIQRVYDALDQRKPGSFKARKVVAVHLLNDYSGSPLIFSEAIKGLIKSGHQVDLFTCGKSKGFLSGLPANNFSFWYKFYANQYLRLVAFGLSQLILFFRLLKYTGKPVDIYINTMLPFGAALAGRLMGKKVIYHLHETSINPPALKKFLKTIAEATANTAIYVSHYLLKTEPLRGVLSTVVYNALPDEFVNKAASYRLHREKNHDRFNVLMLCSLKTYKGINDFVELASKMPHISFDLVLNAKMETIKQYFEGMVLPANLTLHEVTNNVHPFYEKANLVLNLSHPDQWIETFGMTILEAMCYGIPVIAPPVGGVTEIVKPNINGYLKDVRSKHDMQNTIHQLYADPYLCKRLSEQALLTAEKFSLNHMQQEVCRIIEKPVDLQ